MKISVLTVCRNSAGTIRHTLDSFFAQVHEDKELVVVDGASTDATLDIIRSYPQDRMVVLSEPDRGMYDALNKALRLYTGDAFGVLNSDDAYHDATALSRIAEGLATSHMVHGNLHFVKNHAGKRLVRRWAASERPPQGFKSGWMPAHPTFYVQRQVADRVGPFDTQFKLASDYDWMLRCVDVFHFQLHTMDVVLVDMMIGGVSTRSIPLRVAHNIEALKSRRKWIGSYLIDAALFAKPSRKLSQFLCR